MDKLHIRAIAGRNIKVDADWYEYGDKMDCYLTPEQFKDYVDGFLEYEIITKEDNSPKSIDVEFTVVENKEVVKDEQVSRPISSEKRTTGKSTKKVG